MSVTWPVAQLVAASPADSDSIVISLLDTVVCPSLDQKKKSIEPVMAVALVGAIAQRAPGKLGPHLDAKSLVSKISAVSRISAASGDDMDEDDNDEAANTAQAESSETVLLVRPARLGCRALNMLPGPRTIASQVPQGDDAARQGFRRPGHPPARLGSRELRCLFTVDLTLVQNFAGGDDSDEDVDMDGQDEDEAYADE